LLGNLSDESAQILDRSTQTIISQVEAMKFMVNEFAEYARSPQITLKLLDLDELVSEVIDLYKGGDIPVLHRSAGHPLPVRADPGRIRQVLHNLIRNAQQAMTEQGCPGGEQPEVTLSTGLHQEGGLVLVELTITDNGPGFPEDMIDRLFEPYTTTRPKGSGLGLAIVKKIVEEHSGMVLASNVQDGPVELHGDIPARGVAGTKTGARIVIRLPFALPDIPVNTEVETMSSSSILTGSQEDRPETSPLDSTSRHNAPRDLFRRPHETRADADLDHSG
jgi:nitrogen fixation/metabolism regulation signal transduction histidine kinase